jgi:hypothetical protein
VETKQKDNDTRTNAQSSGLDSRIKIVVCVDGGVVYGVYSNQPYANVDVLLVDQDDLEAEGIGRKERDAISERETNYLMEHFIERPETKGATLAD